MGSLQCCMSRENKMNVIENAFSRKDFIGMKTYPITKDYVLDKCLGFGAYG